ncbi:hypothetical protein COF37_08605 [Bacillus wiedmannii]|uniref:hypothetical protein n=1 Tax=Bacillus wiedmannii TaxID=1890302 RepID=UPI000BF047BA|nr:hypothetical protein [Bacillus wiedmannii]PEL17972.1 hypothetical protein CN599_15645 [Bacillus wiedmannii]PHD26371.1 hypothetical protein COF37_08605 [Bacillus wiedmannii]
MNFFGKNTGKCVQVNEGIIFNKNAILVEIIKKDPIRGAGPFNGTIEFYGITNNFPRKGINFQYIDIEKIYMKTSFCRNKENKKSTMHKCSLRKEVTL